MASKAFLDAVYNEVFEGLIDLIPHLPDIPFVDEQKVARDKLYSDEAQKKLWEMIKKAVAAGEAADKKATA